MVARKKSSSRKSKTTRSKSASRSSTKADSFQVREQRELHRLAHYSFFIGLLVAIIAGLPGFQGKIGPEALMTTLVILGFIVGLFNLTARETLPFLIAAITLMLAGIVNLSIIPVVGIYLRAMLSNIVVFVVPGAIIVSLKTIWRLASD